MREIINQENIKRLQALSDAGINVNDFLENIMKFNNESINCFREVVKKIEDDEIISDLSSESKEKTLNFRFDKNNETIIWSKKMIGCMDIKDTCNMPRLNFRHMYNKYYIETFNINIRKNDDDSSLNNMIEELYEMQKDCSNILISYKNLVKEFFLDLNNHLELFSIKMNKIENTNNKSERMLFLLKEQEQVLEFIFKVTHLLYLEISKEYNKTPFSENQKSILSKIESYLERLEKNENNSVDCRNILDNQTKKFNFLLRCCREFIEYKKETDYLTARKLYEKEINVL